MFISFNKYKSYPQYVIWNKYYIWIFRQLIYKFTVLTTIINLSKLYIGRKKWN